MSRLARPRRYRLRWGRFLLMYVTFLVAFFTTQVVVGDVLFPPSTFEAMAYGEPYRGMAPIGLGIAVLVGMCAVIAIFRKVGFRWPLALWMLVPVVGPLSLAIALITWTTREPIAPSGRSATTAH